MDNVEDFLDPAQLLRRTAWLKNLATSLVADHDEAEDIVQDTWLALLRRPPRHPQATNSWLQSVVRKLAYRRYRSVSTRQRHEQLVARRRAAEITPEQVSERFDLQRRLVELVAGIDEPYRSTVLMRFFEDLKPQEIAQRQKVAVTTVRWRLSKALDTLRARLDRAHRGDRDAWRAVFVPFVGLDPRLAAPALATHSASTGLSPLTIGGALMAKKLTLSLGLALLVTAGLGVWQIAARKARAPDVGVRQTSSEQELASKLKRTEAELLRAQTERDALALANKGLQEDAQRLKPSVQVGQATSDTKVEGAPIASATSAILWSDFATLLSKNVGLLEKLQRDEPLSDVEQAQLDLLGAELQKLSAQARTMTAQPFLDSRIFDELTVALFKNSLRLTDDQLMRLHDLNKSIFATLPENAAALGPIDQYQMRKEMVARLRTGMEGILDDEQVRDWAVINRYSDQVFHYGSRMEIGISANPQAFVLNWLGNAFTDRASPALVESLKPIAEGYMQEGSRLLERYAPEGQATRNLPPDQRAAMEKEMLRIQERFHEQVKPFLSEEQRQALLEKPPLLIRFQNGNGISVTERRSPF